MRKRWLATVVLVALVLAGCGDDDDDAADSATTAAAGAATTSAAGSATTAGGSATTAADTTAAAGDTATTAASATTAAATTAAASTATTAAAPATAGGSAAAGADCASAVGDISTATTTLDYTLSEFEIEGAGTVAAGAVGLALDNVGDANHEVLVIKADDYEALPKNANGTIEEDQLASGDVIGEVERFPAKSQCSGVFDLAPGTYQLVCNIEFTNGPTVVSHAGRGMHLALTVT